LQLAGLGCSSLCEIDASPSGTVNHPCSALHLAKRAPPPAHCAANPVRPAHCFYLRDQLAAGGPLATRLPQLLERFWRCSATSAQTLANCSCCAVPSTCRLCQVRHRLLPTVPRQATLYCRRCISCSRRLPWLMGALPNHAMQTRMPGTLAGCAQLPGARSAAPPAPVANGVTDHPITGSAAQLVRQQRLCLQHCAPADMPDTGRLHGALLSPSCLSSQTPVRAVQCMLH